MGVNVDILHKNPKLLAALLKSVNENESYFAQTANGELARVVCRMFLRLAFNTLLSLRNGRNFFRIIRYHSLLYILPMRVSRVLHVDARQPNCVYRPSRLYSQPLSIMS